MVQKDPAVPTPTELTEIAVRHGRDKKRKNAIAALLCGAVPAVLLTFYSGSAAGWELWLLGFIVGLVWGDAFEYVYHRWLLHRPRGPLGPGHHEHHARIGTPEEAEHVALISSPLNILLLFVINGIPAFLVASRMSLWGILSGVFIGWTVYVIVTEEIHWRIHMNGWLPPGLRFARAYHMNHHDIPTSRYNVFLPLFDLLFGSAGRGSSKVPVRPAGN
jgi:sterol desaturase/sphingolipid hydroxylase (fatty acid hydroxylase superfamily)